MSPSLRRDERGAILLLGLFMAVFLMGCAYYLIGLGDAIAQRERMQAAADATALSAATLHARGMNLIALVNMTMTALLAVLVALKLISLVVKVGIAVIMGCSALLGLCAPMMSWVPVLTDVSVKADTAHGNLEPQVHTALHALNVAARGVRASVPFVSQARVAGMVWQAYAPPARGAIAIPTRITLPTRNGTFDELCDRAGGYVGALVKVPFTSIDTGGVVEGAVEAVVDGAPGWFCRGEGKPPETQIDIERRQPQLPQAAACQAHSNRPHDEIDRDELNSQCAEATRETEQSEPDQVTGSCKTACHEGGPYDLRVTFAREQCAPGTSFDEFEWQERRFTRSYVFEEGAWRIDESVPDDPGELRRRNGERRPCGTRRAAVSSAWRMDVRAEPGAPVLPVCSNAAPPEDDGYEGQRLALAHKEIVHILGCITVEKQTFRMQGGKGALKPEGDGSAMAPQVLEESIVLGTETFAIRGLVLGSLPASSPTGVLATLGAKPPSRLERAPMQLGRASIAQAEYFCRTGQANALGDCMWRMGWGARLRRFRWPEPKNGTGETGGAAGSDHGLETGALGIGEVVVDPRSACSLLGEASCELFHSPVDVLH